MSENPLLNKLRNNKMPGVKYRLPSKGMLYKNGEIDSEVIDGEVMVLPMTALDEIYMKSPAMLHSGIAIDLVIKRCVPQILKPLQLFEEDVNYLLTCLRFVSYGNFISVFEKCDVCKSERQEYQIPITKSLQEIKELSSEDIKNYTLTTTENNFNIQFKPATIESAIKIYNVDLSKFDDLSSPEVLKEASDTMISTLVGSIASIDDINDPELIQELLAALPITELKEIEQKIQSLLNWGLDFEHIITCKDCGSKNKVSTVLNPLYFFITP